MLARDMRTTLAKNLAYVERLTGQDAWAANPNLIRTIVSQKKIVEPPDVDIWRLPYLTKLLGQRQLLLKLGMDEEKEEVQELINSLCIS